MAFYGLMKKLGSESVPNSADFRLMSSRALNGLAEYEGSKSLFTWNGPSCGI